MGCMDFGTPIEHQTAQIQVPVAVLIDPGERREYVVHERFQLGFGLSEFIRIHA